MSEEVDEGVVAMCFIVSLVIAIILWCTISAFVTERTDLYLKCETMRNENKRMEKIIENGWADERNINIKMKGESR